MKKAEAKWKETPHTQRSEKQSLHEKAKKFLFNNRAWTEWKLSKETCVINYAIQVVGRFGNRPCSSKHMYVHICTCSCDTRTAWASTERGEHYIVGLSTIECSTNQTGCINGFVSILWLSDMNLVDVDVRPCGLVCFNCYMFTFNLNYKFEKYRTYYKKSKNK